MTKERPPQPIKELQLRQKGLEHLRERRQGWKTQFEDKAGTGSLEDDLKVARAIGTANAAISRYDDKIALNAVPLYRASIPQQEELLSSLRKQTEKGNFPEAALKRRENEHVIFTQKKDTDPVLLRGYQLLEEQKSALHPHFPQLEVPLEESTEPVVDDVIKPKNTNILPDQDNLFDGSETKSAERQGKRQVFEFPLPDGTTLTVKGEMNAKATNILLNAYSTNEPISTEEWAIQQYGEYQGLSSQWKLNAIRRELKAFFVQHNLKIVNVVPNKGRVGGKKGRVVGQFTLQPIEEKQNLPTYSPETPLLENKKERTIPTVHESRIDALRHLFSEESVSLPVLIDILGPDKRGHRLAWPQARRAMENATNILYIRSKKELAEENETMVWNELKTIVGEKNNKIALHILRGQIAEYFQLNRGQYIPDTEIEKQVEEPSPSSEKEISSHVLTNEEMAELSVLIKHRNNTRIKLKQEEITFKIPESIEQVCDVLIDRYVNDENSSGEINGNQELNAKRGIILNKLDQMLHDKGMDIDQVLDQHDDDVKELLIWLYLQDNEELPGAVITFLSENPTVTREVYQRKIINKSYKEWDGRGKVKEARLKTVQTTTLEEIDITNESAENNLQSFQEQEIPLGEIVTIQVPETQEISSELISQMKIMTKEEREMFIKEIDTDAVGTLKFGLTYIQRELPRLKITRDQKRDSRKKVSREEIAEALTRRFPEMIEEHISLLLQLETEKLLQPLVDKNRDTTRYNLLESTLAYYLCKNMDVLKDLPGDETQEFVQALRQTTSSHIDEMRTEISENKERVKKGKLDHSIPGYILPVHLGKSLRARRNT